MLRLVLLALAAVACLGAERYPVLHPEPYLLELEVFSSLDDSYHHQCDAAVINKRYALTAASCVDGVKVYLAHLRHGNLESGGNGTVHQLEKFIIHEKYNPLSVEYNIAVIQAKQSFEPKWVIELARSAPNPGTEVTCTGYARPERVQMEDFPVFEHESCRKIVGEAVTDKVLCAGHLGNQYLHCGGDIGGPLVYKNTLVGVAATKKCGSKKENMGLFADVASLRGWIVPTTGHLISSV